MLELGVAGVSIVGAKFLALASVLFKPAVVAALCCIFLPFALVVAALGLLPRLKSESAALA